MNFSVEHYSQVYQRLSDPDWKKTGRTLSLSQRTVHIWRADLDTARVHEDRLRSLLSIDERERADRFHFERDRVRFSIARGMLRLLTGDYLSRSAQAISFSYTRLGKPYLPSPDTLSFNVSHSHGMALFAFAHGMELGVDIEKHNAELPAADIAGHSFAPDEVRFVAEGQEGKPHERFFFLWSRKEAYAKARGEGLSLPLNGCSLLNGSQEDGFKICSFVPCLHFEGALAMRPGSSKIVFLDFNISAFAI